VREDPLVDGGETDAGWTVGDVPAIGVGLPGASVRRPRPTVEIAIASGSATTGIATRRGRAGIAIAWAGSGRFAGRDRYLRSEAATNARLPTNRPIGTASPIARESTSSIIGSTVAYPIDESSPK
jgi:hypothetical protein